MRWPGRTIWDTRIQGVTGILCAAAEHGVEIYASATFAQATHDPPRMIVNPNRKYAIQEAIRKQGHFSINVIADRNRRLVARLMRMRRREPHKARILGIAVEEHVTRIPYLPQAMQTVFCRVETSLESGDRRLYIARVLDSLHDTDNHDRPLLFADISRSANVAIRCCRSVTAVTGLKDLIKLAAHRINPPPVADIQRTTLELAGSTDAQIARLESYGLSDLGRRLVVPKLPANVDRPLGVCVVGTQWGFEHCRWIRQAYPAARLFVCGRNEARATHVAKRVRAEGYFVGLESAVKDSRIEAVSLVLPHHMHRAAAEQALTAGKHVLVEKPIATTLEDADAMIEAAARAERILMVAENMHFRPAIHEAIARINAGDIGEPLYLLVHGGGIMRPEGWKRDKRLMGGGVLIDIGVHYIRAMRMVMGEPARVFASGSMQINMKLEGEDSVQLLFDGQFGWQAHMLLSWATHRGSLPDIVVAGDSGTLLLWPNKRYIEYYPVAPTWISSLLSHVRPYWLQARLARPEWQRRRLWMPKNAPSGYLAQMKEFLSCVAENREPATSARDARRDLDIALAGYRSLTNRSEVAVCRVD